ncbi:MAG: hypothetical protein KDC44_13055, partial [Phaeodactylibacter sp.]|nr:hypothetical protein [Phaeodactylibacter sp.]
TAVLLLPGLIFFLIPRTPGNPDDQIQREDIDRDTIGQMRVSGPIAAFMVPYDVARLRELGSVQDYLEAYQAGNYSAVIENLPDLIQKGSINANLGHLLVGSSKLFVDDAENALQELQQVAPQSLYGPWAQWYEALALYQTGAKAEARSLLDAIQKHPNPALSNLAQQFLADMPFD